MLAALIPADHELGTGYLSNRAKTMLSPKKLAVAKIEKALVDEGPVRTSKRSRKRSGHRQVPASIKLRTVDLRLHPAHHRCDDPDLQPYIKEGFRVLKDDSCSNYCRGMLGLDSSLIRPQEHRAVQEVMELVGTMARHDGDA